MRAGSFIFLLLAIYIGYLLYVPVPPGVEEPLKYRFIMAATKFMFNMAELRTWLPHSNYNLAYVQILRLISEALGSHTPVDFGPGVTVTKTMFDGVEVKVYQPPDVDPDTPLPGFVYFHGGGLAILTADHYQEYTKWMSLTMGMVVVSVNYRRTPEVRFPEPLKDCITATKWFILHAKEYNVDPNRIGIGGDSAGGYLTATVSHAIYDDASLPSLKIQVLIYPWLQFLDHSLPSFQEYHQTVGDLGHATRTNIAYLSSAHVYGIDNTIGIAEAFRINNHTSSEFVSSELYQSRLGHDLIPQEFKDSSFYVKPDIKNKSFNIDIWETNKNVFTDSRFSPMLRKDLSGLPKAYIVTVEYDALRNEGMMYGSLLKKAGVDVTMKDYPGAMHGICWFGASFQFEHGTRINEEIFEFMKNNL